MRIPWIQEKHTLHWHSAAANGPVAKSPEKKLDDQTIISSSSADDKNTLLKMSQWDDAS